MIVPVPLFPVRAKFRYLLVCPVPQHPVTQSLIARLLPRRERTGDIAATPGMDSASSSICATRTYTALCNRAVLRTDGRSLRLPNSANLAIQIPLQCLFDHLVEICTFLLGI